MCTNHLACGGKRYVAMQYHSLDMGPETVKIHPPLRKGGKHYLGTDFVTGRDYQ